MRGKRADALAARLVTALAAQTGKLADPTDLPVSDDLLDEDGMPDPAKVDEAVVRLIEVKPHLASTRPQGDIGQGARSDVADLPGLGSLLRSAALGTIDRRRG